jgi:hypothetical protein
MHTTNHTSNFDKPRAEDLVTNAAQAKSLSSLIQPANQLGKRSYSDKDQNNFHSSASEKR